MAQEHENSGVEFEYKGSKYSMSKGDMTAVESRDFRREMGFPYGAMDLADFDIDVMATIIWLIDRRTNPTLTWLEVAQEMTYLDIQDIEVVSEEDDEDPSPSGGTT